MKVRLTKLTVLIFLFSSVSALAQNKTLAVGTPAPNANAALHVESPTGNQGFIMPRLTSAQRTAMAGLLAAADQGLMLFDTDLKTIFIWDGAAWKSTAEVAGGTKLAYPYKDSVTVATGTTDVFALKYNAPQNARVLRVENLRTDNGSSAVSVLNNGTGLAGYFQVNNPTSGSSAIYGTTNSNLGGAVAPVGVYGESSGTGSLGGAFWNTNAANNFPALYTRTQGTGSSATFEIVNPANTSPVLVLNTDGTGNALQTAGRIQAGQFVGDGSLLTNIVSSPVTFPFATSDAGATPLFDLTNTGTSSAGRFAVDNPGNSSHAFEITNNGTGALLRGTSTGTGRGAWFSITGAASPYPALRAETTGTGFAGYFWTQNVGSTAPTVGIDQTGVGPGIAMDVLNVANTYPGISVRYGGDSTAGAFIVDNSNATALIGQTNGGGFGVHGISDNTSAGFAVGVMGEVNTNVFGIGVFGKHTGTSGFAGSFEIQNPANGGFGVKGSTDGTGAGVYGVNYGTGNGSAGVFEITEVSNSAPTMNVSTVGMGAAANFNISEPSNNISTINANTDGTGNGGYFSVNNPTSGASGVYATTNGTGAAFQAETSSGFASVFAKQDGGGNAIYAENNGSVGGMAGYFFLTNASNTSPAIQAGTQGIGSGVRVLQDATSIGSGIDISIQNPSSTAIGLFVDNQGQGDGIFSTITGPGAAIVGRSEGEGQAGAFNIDNGSNTSAALLAETNGTGAAIFANQTNGGLALEITNGGIKLSTATLTGGGPISTRAAAYLITDAASGSYTFSGGISFFEGEMIYIFNADSSNAIVDSFVIQPDQGVVAIYMGGGLRFFYYMAP